MILLRKKMTRLVHKLMHISPLIATPPKRSWKLESHSVLSSAMLGVTAQQYEARRWHPELALPGSPCVGRCRHATFVGPHPVQKGIYDKVELAGVAVRAGHHHRAIDRRLKKLRRAFRF